MKYTTGPIRLPMVHDMGCPVGSLIGRHISCVLQRDVPWENQAGTHGLTFGKAYGTIHQTSHVTTHKTSHGTHQETPHKLRDGPCDIPGDSQWYGIRPNPNPTLRVQTLFVHTRHGYE